jgi:hypothetical protein
MVSLLVPLLLSLLLGLLLLTQPHQLMFHRLNLPTEHMALHPRDQILHPDHEGPNLALYNLNLDLHLRGMATEQEEMLRDIYMGMQLREMHLAGGSQ